MIALESLILRGAVESNRRTVSGPNKESGLLRGSCLASVRTGASGLLGDFFRLAYPSPPCARFPAAYAAANVTY